MKETLDLIREMQAQRQQIDTLKRDRENLMLDVKGMQRRLNEMEHRAQQMQEQRKEANKQADRLQLKIGEAEAEIKRLEQQRNVTKHQKEYDALTKSILSHKADIQKWEDEALEAFATVDSLQEEAKKLVEQVAEAKADVERTRREVAEKQKEYDAEIAGEEESCRALRDSIDPAVLAAYERLEKSTLASPLATVRGRVCQGCFTQLTKQTELLLRRDADIVYCNSCGRMLVMED